MSRPLGDWVLIVLLSCLGALALDHVRRPAPAQPWLPAGDLVPGQIYRHPSGATVELLPEGSVCAPPQPHYGGPV